MHLSSRTAPQMRHLKVFITLLCKATLGLVRLLVKSYQAPHPGRYGISAPLQQSLAGLFVSLSLSSFLFVGRFCFFFFPSAPQDPF